MDRGVKARAASTCIGLLGRIVPSMRFQAGVDIGTHAARFVVIEKTRKGEVLRDCWKEERKGRAESEILRETIDNLGKSLGRIAGRWGYREIPVVLAVSGRGEIVRKLAMPPMPGKEMRKAVLLKMEKEIAALGEEVTMGYVQGGSAPEGTQPEITAAVFSSPALEEVTLPFEEAGFLNIAPVASPMLCSRIVPHGPPCMLVDIGCEKTRIHVSSKGSVFYRDIGSGGANLTAALTGRFSYAKGVLELNSEGAENLKRQLGLSAENLARDGGDIAYSHIPTILKMELAKFADEIRRTLDYAREGLSIVPGTVCLSGGGASLPGLVSYLEKALGMDVKLLDLSDMGVRAGNDVPGNTVMHEHGLAVGAATWTQSQGLLRTRAARMRRISGLERRLFRTAAVLLAGFITLYSSLTVGLAGGSRVDGVLANYCTLMAGDLGYRTRALDEEKEMLVELRSLLSLTPPVRSDQVSLLREVSHLVPDEVILTKLEMRGTPPREASSSLSGMALPESAKDSTSVLRMEGIVRTSPLLLESTLSEFTRTLRNSGLFEDVRVLSWSRQEEKGTENVSFAISMDIPDQEGIAR